MLKEILKTATKLDRVEIVNAARSYPNDQDLGKWLRSYIKECSEKADEPIDQSKAWREFRPLYKSVNSGRQIISKRTSNE